MSFVIRNTVFIPKAIPKNSILFQVKFKYESVELHNTIYKNEKSVEFSSTCLLFEEENI